MEIFSLTSAPLMSRRLDLGLSGRMENNYWLAEVPIPLHWCGWTSDTVTLQRCGWQFAMENDFMQHALKFAMMNKSINARGAFSLSRIELADDVRQGMPPKEVEVHLAQKLRVILQGYDVFGRAKWRPVDISEMKALGVTEHSGFDIDEIAMFRPLPANAPADVYLHEANLDQVLEHALKLQEPTQAEIRQKILEEKERRKFKGALVFDSEPKATLRLIR